MNTKQLTFSLIIAGALLLGYNQTAAAHTYNLGALGSAATATDYFQVDCTTTGDGTQLHTHHLLVHIQDKLAGSNLVGVSVFHANGGANLKAATTFDPVGGLSAAAQIAYSPSISIAGGEGIYNLAVFKTATGAQAYSLLASCEDAFGSETNAFGLGMIPAQLPIISNQ